MVHAHHQVLLPHSFISPVGIVSISSGLLLIADTDKILSVRLDESNLHAPSSVTPWAGGSALGFAGNPGHGEINGALRALNHNFTRIEALAYDSLEHALYVADKGSILKVPS